MAKAEMETLKGELDTQESLEKFAASISAPLRIKKLEADLNRLKDAADGRGMVSEMADLPEVAVLVCGLHDEVDRLRAELDEYKSWANGRRPERVNKEIEQLRADLSACRKELDEAREKVEKVREWALDFLPEDSGKYCELNKILTGEG